MATQNRTDWPDKDSLPSASDLLALLQQGASCRVNGHILSPDEHGVWITDPYGVDRGLWQELTVQRVEKFLADIIAGKDCGLVP